MWRWSRRKKVVVGIMVVVTIVVFLLVVGLTGERWCNFSGNCRVGYGR
jgi:hypothetical protein